MPNLNAIISRIQSVADKADNPIPILLAKQLTEQHYQAQFDADFIAQLCEQHHCTPVDIALQALPLAASYSLTPISQFNVGAVAIGQSGKFYLGANQEFTNVAIQQTVHAEQSATMHAWISGEKGISDIVVNYTPCGHCRQFLNELNSAEQLKIHLPHSQNNLLHSYLPDSFGPKDLGIERKMFDAQFHRLPTQGDQLQCAAIQAAEKSYAPYSQTLSGIALQAGEQIFTGSYAENAAFNPSFLPLQAALNYYRLSGCEQRIQRVVLAEKVGTTSLRQMSEMLAQQYLNLTLEYVAL
jgi:cytidine deaminase